MVNQEIAKRIRAILDETQLCAIYQPVTRPIHERCIEAERMFLALAEELERDAVIEELKAQEVAR
jgi:hypothetical protein